MARIRTIKPEFWTDDRVGECSPSARLLFLAFLNFADDHGSIDRSARQIKAQAFPYDQIDCEPLIQELLKAGLLVEYEHEQKIFLHIIGFRKHQKVEKPGKPRYPLYEESLRLPIPLPESSPSPPRGVAVSSSEGNGREGKGSQRESANAPPSRAKHRVPETWEPATVDRDRLRLEYPGVAFDRELEKFRDCEFRTAHKDWDATWRNWVRRAHEQLGSGRGLNGLAGRVRAPYVPPLTVAQIESEIAKGWRDANGSRIPGKHPDLPAAEGAK